MNEDFFKAMSDMNLEGGSEGELDFLPLMQGMMQNLLSKDVLYPALKDLQEKVVSTNILILLVGAMYIILDTLTLEQQNVQSCRF